MWLMLKTDREETDESQLYSKPATAKVFYEFVNIQNHTANANYKGRNFIHFAFVQFLYCFEYPISALLEDAFVCLCLLMISIHHVGYMKLLFGPSYCIALHQSIFTNETYALMQMPRSKHRVHLKVFRTNNSYNSRCGKYA